MEEKSAEAAEPAARLATEETEMVAAEAATKERAEDEVRVGGRWRARGTCWGVGE